MFHHITYVCKRSDISCFQYLFYKYIKLNIYLLSEFIVLSFIILRQRYLAATHAKYLHVERVPLTSTFMLM